jgi:hypothetical protein
VKTQLAIRVWNEVWNIHFLLSAQVPLILTEENKPRGTHTIAMASLPLTNTERRQATATTTPILVFKILQGQN